METHTAWSAATNLTDLRRAGCSAEEIERLARLREVYPYIEWVESRREWQALLFLKWRYETGQLSG